MKLLFSGGFEACLKNSPTVQNNDGFILLETFKCWKALQDCWSDGIYIEALAHKFWKLSLQLLSRYATWIKSISSRVSPSLKWDKSIKVVIKDFIN